MEIGIVGAVKSDKKNKFSTLCGFVTAELFMLFVCMSVGGGLWSLAAGLIFLPFYFVKKRYLFFAAAGLTVVCIIFRTAFLSGLANAANLFSHAFGNANGVALKLLKTEGSGKIIFAVVFAFVMCSLSVLSEKYESRAFGFFAVAVQILFVLVGIADSVSAVALLMWVILGRGLVSCGVKKYWAVSILYMAICVAFTFALSGTISEYVTNSKLANNLRTSVGRHTSSSDEISVLMENPTAMYLCADRYENYDEDVWYKLGNGQRYAARDTFYWLNSMNFSTACPYKLLENVQAENVSRLTINAKNGCVLYPYYVSKVSGEKSDGKIDGAYSGKVIKYEIQKSEDITEKLTENKSDSKYLQAEALYHEYVKQNCLKVSETDKQIVLNNIDVKGKTVGKIKTAVQNFILNTVTYDKNGKNAKGDIVNQLVEKMGTGNASDMAKLAAVMLRSCGVSARYCEGYVVTESMVKGLPKNSEIKLSQKNFHAWTEYYTDGIGWQPIEVCPEYAGKTGIAGDTVPTVSKTVSDDKKALTKEQKNEILADKNTDEKSISILFAVLIFVLILLLAWIAFVRIRLACRQRRLRKLDNKSYCEAVFLSGRKMLVDLLKCENIQNEVLCEKLECGIAKQFKAALHAYEKSRYSKLDVDDCDRKAVKEFEAEAVKLVKNKSFVKKILHKE